MIMLQDDFDVSEAFKDFAQNEKNDMRKKAIRNNQGKNMHCERIPVELYTDILRILEPEKHTWDKYHM